MTSRLHASLGKLHTPDSLKQAVSEAPCSATSTSHVDSCCGARHNTAVYNAVVACPRCFPPPQLILTMSSLFTVGNLESTPVMQPRLSQETQRTECSPDELVISLACDGDSSGYNKGRE